MKYFLAILLFASLQASAQKNDKSIKRPKLMIGLVVDQMRYDFYIAITIVIPRVVLSVYCRKAIPAKI
ncbi:hypothetical protein EMGBS15_03150 [Filimonas sp.]|nr:hypothetical protein EMGBS15_03150 [Filimonas sp.]